METDESGQCHYGRGLPVGVKRDACLSQRQSGKDWGASKTGRLAFLPSIWASVWAADSWAHFPMALVTRAESG